MEELKSGTGSPEGKRFLPLILVGLIVIIFVAVNGTAAPNPSGQQELNQTIAAKNADEGKEEFEFVLQVVNALGAYYSSTQDYAEDLHPISMMQELMRRNSALKEGNAMLDGYLNSQNEVINLVSKGMIAGAYSVIKANEEMIETLRKVDFQNPNLSEFNYVVAKTNSEKKEAYKLILQTAPFANLLIIESPGVESPTGPITFKMNKDRRNQVLKKFDSYLSGPIANEARGGDRNSILLAGSMIRTHLTSETYEELDSANW